MKRFWNRAEFYTLAVVALLLLLVLTPLLLLTVPFALASNVARWLHKITIARMERLSMAYLMRGMR